MIHIKEIKVKVFVCQRCGHEWQPRDPKNVRICPKCKSARYDTPKRD